MSKFVISISENGSSIGYVGRVAVHLDPETDRLRSDYPVAEHLQDAMIYHTRDAAERLVEDFKTATESGVEFCVTELPGQERDDLPEAIVVDPQEDTSNAPPRHSGLKKAVQWIVTRFKR
jgi:hypothetical protein